MSMPVRFALVGKSGSGKSTVSLSLCRLLGVDHIKTGAVCRQIACTLFGNEDKRSTQTLDDALTTIDASIFLRAALRPYGNNDGYIIDALRFESDAILARSLGCRIIRVIAPPGVRHTRLEERGQKFDPVTDEFHRSETELDFLEVDHELENSGDIDLLEKYLVNLLKQENLA